MSEAKDVELFKAGPPAPNVERYPLAEKYEDRYGSSLVKEGASEADPRLHYGGAEVEGDEHKDVPILNHKLDGEVRKELGYEGQVTELPLSAPGKLLRSHALRKRIGNLMEAVEDRVVANCSIVLVSRELQLAQVEEETPYVLVTKGFKIRKASSFLGLAWAVFKGWVLRR